MEERLLSMVKSNYYCEGVTNFSLNFSLFCLSNPLQNAMSIQQNNSCQWMLCTTGSFVVLQENTCAFNLSEKTEAQICKVIHTVTRTQPLKRWKFMFSKLCIFPRQTTIYSYWQLASQLATQLFSQLSGKKNYQLLKRCSWGVYTQTCMIHR